MSVRVCVCACVRACVCACLCVCARYSFALEAYVCLLFNLQFKDFSVAFETLFSLLNGDDIYETFRAITTLDDLAAYIYSRFYFYVFLILFIYAVLNIFTSLVISAYESSQVSVLPVRREGFGDGGGRGRRGCHC